MEYLGQSKIINQIKPLVSVCVPTYGHETFISSCLESILNQRTEFPYEILIGEDESLDKTRELCIHFAQKNQDKIRLFLRKDSQKIILFGKKAGRGNQLSLFKEARGTFVCFCDGDDCWNDEFKLQKQVDAMQNYPEASMCITNSYWGGNADKKLTDLPQRIKLFSKVELRKKFYMGHISSWMVKNQMNLLLENKIVGKPMPLDKIIFSFYKRGKVISLPDVTTTYRFNPSGIFLSQSKKISRLENLAHYWYLFRYINRDLPLFLRAVFYDLRRFLVSLGKGKFT